MDGHWSKMKWTVVGSVKANGQQLVPKWPDQTTIGIKVDGISELNQTIIWFKMDGLYGEFGRPWVKVEGQLSKWTSMRLKMWEINFNPGPSTSAQIDRPLLWNLRLVCLMTAHFGSLISSVWKSPLLTVLLSSPTQWKDGSLLKSEVWTVHFSPDLKLSVKYFVFKNVDFEKFHRHEKFWPPMLSKNLEKSSKMDLSWVKTY